MCAKNHTQNPPAFDPLALPWCLKRSRYYIERVLEQAGKIPGVRRRRAIQWLAGMALDDIDRAEADLLKNEGA